MGNHIGRPDATVTRVEQVGVVDDGRGRLEGHLGFEKQAGAPLPGRQRAAIVVPDEKENPTQD